MDVEPTAFRRRDEWGFCGSGIRKADQMYIEPRSVDSLQPIDERCLYTSIRHGVNQVQDGDLPHSRVFSGKLIYFSSFSAIDRAHR